MVIVVTGEIGIGKTTVCDKALKMLQSAGFICGGILTYKAVDGSLTVLDIQTGERKTLASAHDRSRGPRTGKYFFSVEGIEFGLKAIERGITSDVLFVDEIGYLELYGDGFARSLELIKAQKPKNSILVIRKQLVHAFLARLGDNPSILETTISTRNQLPHKICSPLTANLPAVSSNQNYY